MADSSNMISTESQISDASLNLAVRDPSAWVNVWNDNYSTPVGLGLSRNGMYISFVRQMRDYGS